MESPFGSEGAATAGLSMKHQLRLEKQSEEGGSRALVSLIKHAGLGG